ncbi:ABC-2 transporter permease [Bacillus xiapuensis]|uniref:ABC-2 transporter permease n=1 Tax=Bacillus xiapuensis TaxID=2014075 RepID=UPI0018E28D0B|nr:ABC-2 transporter permease [Bacillus xiapuensis]
MSSQSMQEQFCSGCLFAMGSMMLIQAALSLGLGLYDQPLAKWHRLLLSLLLILFFVFISFPALYKFGERYTGILLRFFLIFFITLRQSTLKAFNGEITDIQR